MEYKAESGRALVITGPQGCGKSTLARKIANKSGSFIETTVSQLVEKKGFNDLMRSEPNTLIVEGFPDSEDLMTKIKGLITSDIVMVEKKHGAPKIVKSPGFIFCSGEVDALLLRDSDRRFSIIRL